MELKTSTLEKFLLIILLDRLPTICDIFSVNWYDNLTSRYF
ncbi:MAG: hypothetical protein SWX82_23380 [Cyanobacteriota bacterium]|nr:hypothetical protein [Cyanobacteriota bacterium]